MNPTTTLAALMLIVIVSILADAVVDFLRKGKNFNHALDFGVWFGITFLIIIWVAGYENIAMIGATVQWYFTTRAKWFHLILNRMKDLPDQYKNPKSSFWDEVQESIGIRWDKMNLIVTWTWIASTFVFLAIGANWLGKLGLEDQAGTFIAVLLSGVFAIMMLYLTGIWDKIEQKLNEKGLK